MTKSPIIEVSHISKKYRLVKDQLPYRLLRDEIAGWFSLKKPAVARPQSFWALKNVSFTVKEGEVVGIIGPNGAGKSTLLKILSQITSPTAGQAILHGRVASLLEVGTGFSPELTGRENIYLNGAILGMSRPEIKRKLAEIIDFAEVGRFIDMPVKHYSSGMYVRLAFSIAAHLEPEILIVDEILAVGDARFQRKSLGKMDDVARKRGRTVLFVSHDLGAIRNLCSKALLLEKGRMVTFGPAEAVVSTYLGEVNKNIPDVGKDITKKVTRWGSGEMYIKKIELRSSRGEPVKYAQTGQDLRVLIHYGLKRGAKVKNIMVGILVKTELGTPVFVQHNLLTGDEFGPISKPGVFTLHLPKLPLVPSVYNVNCSLVKDQGRTGQYYDSIHDAFKIHVVEGEFFKSHLLPHPEHGAVVVKGEWSHAVDN